MSVRERRFLASGTGKQFPCSDQEKEVKNKSGKKKKKNHYSVVVIVRFGSHGLPGVWFSSVALLSQ